MHPSLTPESITPLTDSQTGCQGPPPPLYNRQKKTTQYLNFVLCLLCGFCLFGPTSVFYATGPLNYQIY